MTVRVVTDSTCDLPQEIVEALSISVVPCYINVGTDSYLDGIDITREQFYEKLPTFKTPATTSAPGIGTFVKVYENLVEHGATAIISIHISETLSNVANVARMATQAFTAAPVFVIDPGQLSLGTGLLAQVAARATIEGGNIDEIVHMIQEMARRTYTFAALDSLEFLRRSGRVSTIASALGSLLQIKPLLKMHAGKVNMDKAYTTRKAVSRILEMLGNLGSIEQFGVVHTHAIERAHILGEQVRSLLPGGLVPVYAEVTPVIGAHIGPGATGFSCIAARGLSSLPDWD